VDGPPDGWAGWSGVQVGRHVKNVEVGQTSYPVNRAEMEGREGSERQSYKAKEREGGSGMWEVP